MLRDVAVQRIQDGLGFRTDLTDTIVLRLQEEQRDLERGKTLPKFLLLEDQTLTLSASSYTVDLPSNFLRRADVAMRYTPTGSETTQTVVWRSLDASFETWDDADPSGPQVAVLRTTSIRFFPTADRDYTLTWSYYKKADLLTTNIENDWLENAPELLIGGAGMRIAKDARNKTALELFKDMYSQARMTWFGETVLDEVQDEALILGLDN